MSYNTEWDVDKYKTEYESEEHWQLRRCFMVTHKNKFPEERLVCLAQVFTNIEFMGCRYPAETMELVGQLSQGVADGYREKQKTKLQRTFVKASDAAGAKVKGLKRPLGDAADTSDSPPKIPKCSNDTLLPQNNILNTSDISKCSDKIQLSQNTISSTTETLKGLENKLLLIKPISAISTPVCSVAKQLPPKAVSSTSWIVSDMDTNIKSTSTASQLKTCALVQAAEPLIVTMEGTEQEESNGTEMNGFEEKSKPVNKDDCKLINEAKKPCKLKNTSDFHVYSRDLDGEVTRKMIGLYDKLILFEHLNCSDPFKVLTYSTQHCHIPFQLEYVYEQSSTCCKVFVNNHLLTSAYGFHKIEARARAIEEAYNKLIQICYVLKIKASDGYVVERAELVPVETDSLETPLEENIGSKLMRAMGWTGGGLGKEQQGIHEPIRPSFQVRRTGLGLEGRNSTVQQTQIFRIKILKMLQEYIQKNETRNLEFSSDFTKEERKIAHQLCCRLNLKSRSYGKGEDRRLIVSLKTNFCKIVEEMLRTGEYSNSLYELIKPPIALPPENETLAQSTCENNVKREDAVFSPVDASTKVPEDQPPMNITDIPCENISVIAKPADFPVQNVDGITGPFGCLVLIEDETVVTPIQIIERSANGCHIPFKFEYGNMRKGGMVCKLLINNVLVASSTEVSKKRAREVTVSRSLQKLQDVCCTVKTQIKVVDGCISILKCLKQPNKSSVGYGKDSKTHIVCASKEVDWPSLGVEHGDKALSLIKFKDKIKTFLQKYQCDNCPYDLIISSEFSGQQKSWIQRIASSLALKTTKYDASQKEFMVISKKLSIIELAKAILISGGNVPAPIGST